MAEENDSGKVVISVDLETGKFETAINNAKNTVGGFVEKGVNKLMGFNVALIAMNSAVELASKAFTELHEAFSIESAHRVEGINNQKLAFRSLSQQIGVDSNVMLSAIKAATHGTVSDLDAINAATDLIYSGVDAKLIPSLAKAAVQIEHTGRHGEKFSEIVRNMSMAIESGTTRGMRQYDIILSKVGDRQAVTNAILSQSAEHFEGYADRVEHSMKKMEVKSDSYWLKIKSGASNITKNLMTTLFGDEVDKNVMHLNALEKKLKELKTLESQGKDVKAGIAIVERELAKEKQLNSKLSEEEAHHEEELNNKIKEGAKFRVPLLEQQKRRAELAAQILHLESRASEEANTELGISTKTMKDLLALKKQKIDQETIQKRQAAEVDATDEEELTQKLLKIEEARYSKIRRLSVDDTVFKDAQREGMLSRIENDLRGYENAEEVHRQITEQKETELYERKLEQLREAGLEENNFRFQMEVEESMHQARMRDIKSQYNEINNRNFQMGINSGLQSLQKQYGDFTKIVGNMTTKTHGIMSKSFVEAAKGHGNAMELMKQQFLEMIGTQMIESGVYHMLAGIWPPNPMELGQGAALVAAGSALVGASGGSPSASAGGASGGDFLSSPLTPGQATQQEMQKKQASIIINGDFLNSRETANHLQEIIRQNSDITDYSITAQGRSYA